MLPAVTIVILNWNGKSFLEQFLPSVTSPYYVLLNNDVEVHPDWLGPLVEMMESDPQVAAVQPKLLSFQQRDHFEYAGAAGGYVDVLDLACSSRDW